MGPVSKVQSSELFGRLQCATMLRGIQLLLVALVTVAGREHFVDVQLDGTHIYPWNPTIPVNLWQNFPYVYFPVVYPPIRFSTQAPSYYVPDLKTTFKEMCEPVNFSKCRREAQLCLDLGLALRDSFSTKTSVVNCASQNGIGLFALLAANSPTKTNAEVLRDAGADEKTATAIFRCVLNRLGFARNNVLDVDKVKTVLRPIIVKDIKKPDQRAATLAALNTCPRPDIDGIRAYVICLSNACVNGR